MRNFQSLVDYLKESIQRLESTSSSPGLDARLILKKVLGFSDTQLITKSDYLLSEDQAKHWETLIQRRLQGEPMAYIIGRKGFMNFDFMVGEGVLIPRPDTELLVETLAGKIGSSKGKGLEIGIGSGCISGTLLKLCENLEMRASDLSDQAIDYAKKNVKNLGVSDRIEIFKADLIDDKEIKYDFIVSNPPYIDQLEYDDLMRDVKEYEPKLALYGGKDGLDYYRNILSLSHKVVKNGGFIAFEIGCKQGDALKQLLREHSYKNIQVLKDLAAKDRVVIGVKDDK